MSALAAVRSSQCLHLDGRQLPPRHWQACQTHEEPCAPAEHRRRFKYGTDCNRGIIIAAHVKRGLQTRLWIGWDALFATSRPTPQRQRTCLSLALGLCHTLGSPLPLRTRGGDTKEQCPASAGPARAGPRSLNSMPAASSLQTLVALAAVAEAFSPAAQAKPRHLVLIVADDLGYADLGYAGSEIRTPNIDGLANRGVDMHCRAVRAGTRSAVRTRGARRLAPRLPCTASLLRLCYVQRTVAPQANSGVKLGNFYVQRACSPTRAALLTGRYNIRYGFQSGVLTDNIS